jgi:hypothetical protein
MLIPFVLVRARWRVRDGTDSFSREDSSMGDKSPKQQNRNSQQKQTAKSTKDSARKAAAPQQYVPPPVGGKGKK